MISTGPYAVIRHPRYFAFIPFMVGTPLVLGSWFGAAFGALFMILPARRAVMEEQMLVNGLEGYKGYIEKVRYRLIPYVWRGVADLRADSPLGHVVEELLNRFFTCPF